jgi:hypothetical protein
MTGIEGPIGGVTQPLTRPASAVDRKIVRILVIRFLLVVGWSLIVVGRRALIVTEWRSLIIPGRWSLVIPRWRALVVAGRTLVISGRWSLLVAGRTLVISGRRSLLVAGRALVISRRWSLLVARTFTRRRTLFIVHAA